jgi:hypothetical protein
MVGGSHLSAAKLIQNLDQARYRPVVVLHRPEGDLADLLRAGGIPFEPAPSERFLDGSRLAADAVFVMTETLRLARFQWLLQEATGYLPDAHNDWQDGVLMLRYDHAIFCDGPGHR